ncbi:hypothetical protein A3A38_04930 [Candidatus Kaiserbacteria bacterium RIFCSPLOWO2_01_FULL_53_17]|uniref:SMC-Scp complex subunit ScpB n=1 Tax=Candidatus Kaiserbacteria bacterium RIFCSPLOWO2_01_FULL_53_17 TaxID=1798511 RepID=A0A1F6EGT5_9BACT|nr:MAG: hypothetical protein A3A38_04930 [Candidatus Kaiserbacteria bacterium RIFCSPLOWO2_01_FULL_53_17]
MNTDSHIEALLFFKAHPMGVQELARMLGKKPADVEEGLAALEKRLVGHGVRLVRTKDAVALATASEAARHIEELRKEELSGELGRATLETLTIILYRAPVRKSEIDYIRGVNSASSMRTLLVRGLVARARDEGSARGFVYMPTIDTLACLGVSRVEELPQYSEVRTEVEQFRREFQNEHDEDLGESVTDNE